MIRLDSVNRAEAVRYLGGAGLKLDDRMTALLDECESELLKTAAPKYLYKTLELPNPEIIAGEDIKAHLSGCGKAVVMCATLGAGTDRLIRQAQITDMARAVVLDSLASAAIEQVCSEIDKIVASENPGLFQTFRYSPGYGDYPLELQRVFLRLLDAPRKIGLSVNESFLLIPTKSVTAISGLSESPVEKKRRGCAVCGMRESCAYRKRGERCEF